MLGAIQGGENAFGQYEIVKPLDEEISDKHLVTSGKSHIELYEDGKISAIVADPIRTDAKVKYGSQVNDELSVDAVSQRPIADLVDVEALSNANCQLVLDTSSNHGTLSASTHFYDPSGIAYGELAKSVGYLSAISGEVRNDFSFLAGNNGLVDVV